jgi:hypothetical protein
VDRNRVLRPVQPGGRQRDDLASERRTVHNGRILAASAVLLACLRLNHSVAPTAYPGRPPPSQAAPQPDRQRHDLRLVGYRVVPRGNGLVGY